MSAEEQAQQVDYEANAIRNMINEGGLGADIYYIESSNKKTEIKSKQGAQTN